MHIAARVLRVARTEGAAGVARRLVRRSGRSLRVVSRRLAQRLGLPVVRSEYGIRLAANWRDATFRLYAEGGYGNFLSDRIGSRRTPFVFFDIGANQGLYSILAARNPVCTGIYAFEPVPTTAALLRRNVSLNPSGVGVRVIPSAISAIDGPLTIAVHPGHTGGARLTDQNASSSHDIDLIEIQSTSRHGLDALECDGSVAIVVKIDVEGHEETVLTELLASRHAPRISEIFYECDEGWVDPARLEHILRQAGFSRFTRIGEGRHYDVLAERGPTA